MGMSLYIDGVVLRDVSKDELPSKLEEIELMIQYYRDKLMILSGAGVPMNASQMVEEWSDAVRREIASILEGLEEAYVTKHLIEVAIGNPEDVKESC